MRQIYYYDTRQGFEAEDFACRLSGLIRQELLRKHRQRVLYLCIGTDRSTGDSLGPLIGYKLKQQKMEGIPVIGTLKRPVHAVNLESYRRVLDACYPDALVVAVDASVGKQEQVGCISLGIGCLRPGLGVRKELQPVGDIFITGVVGDFSAADPLLLQSVRLSTVMQMADCISRGIFLVEKLYSRAARI